MAYSFRLCTDIKIANRMTYHAEVLLSFINKNVYIIIITETAKIYTGM